LENSGDFKIQDGMVVMLLSIRQMVCCTCATRGNINVIKINSSGFVSTTAGNAYLSPGFSDGMG